MMTINELKKSLEENDGRKAIESLISKLGTKDKDGNVRLELESFNRAELVKRFGLTNQDEWTAEAEAEADRKKGVSDDEIANRVENGYYLKKYVTDIVMKAVAKAFEFKEDAFVEKCTIEMDKDNVISFNGEVVANPVDETVAEETKEEAVVMANSAPVQHDASCTCGCNNSQKTLKEKIEFVNKKSNKFDAIT